MRPTSPAQAPSDLAQSRLRLRAPDRNPQRTGGSVPAAIPHQQGTKLVGLLWRPRRESWSPADRQSLAPAPIAAATAHRIRAGAFRPHHVPASIGVLQSLKAIHRFNGSQRPKHFSPVSGGEQRLSLHAGAFLNCFAPRPCSDRSNADGYRGRGRGDPPVCRAAAPYRPPARAQRQGRPRRGRRTVIALDIHDRKDDARHGRRRAQVNTAVSGLSPV
jgi:hypothetical protein